MPALHSKLDAAGDAFQRNRARMLALIERLRALVTCALMLDDGIIDPRDTRNVLGYALSIRKDGDARTVRPVQFGVARP